MTSSLPDHDSWVLAFEFGVRVAETLLGSDETLFSSEVSVEKMRALLMRVSQKKQDLGNLSMMSDDLLAGLTIEYHQKAGAEYKAIIQGRIDNCGRDSVKPELLKKLGL
jgi:hypothetical protein